MTSSSAFIRLYNNNNNIFLFLFKNARASYDFSSNDPYPYPRYTDDWFNRYVKYFVRY